MKPLNFTLILAAFAVLSLNGCTFNEALTTVTKDAAAVAGEADTITTDAGEVAGDIEKVEGDVKTVEGDAEAVKKAAP